MFFGTAGATSCAQYFVTASRMLLYVFFQVRSTVLYGPFLPIYLVREKNYTDSLFLAFAVQLFPRAEAVGFVAIARGNIYA